MKKVYVVSVSVLIIIIIISVIIFKRKEKYEAPPVASNCAQGYIQTCISASIPGGVPPEAHLISNTCPDTYFVMCIPDVEYQLISPSICPPGYAVHPGTHKCAPLSSIKVFNAKKNTQNAS